MTVLLLLYLLWMFFPCLPALCTGTLPMPALPPACIYTHAAPTDYAALSSSPAFALCQSLPATCLLPTHLPCKPAWKLGKEAEPLGKRRDRGAWRREEMPWCYYFCTAAPPAMPVFTYLPATSCMCLHMPTTCLPRCCISSPAHPFPCHHHFCLPACFREGRTVPLPSACLPHLLWEEGGSRPPASLHQEGISGQG